MFGVYALLCRLIRISRMIVPSAEESLTRDKSCTEKLKVVEAK